MGMEGSTQMLVDIFFGVVIFLGGWLFKVIFSQINRQQDSHRELQDRAREDYRKLSDSLTELALSLPEKYVTKGDFTKLADQIDDRFDKLEVKLDKLNEK